MTTPESLPPFSGDDAKCPKCSNEGAFTEHKKAGVPRSDGYGGMRLPERLERRCGRCDFTWDEALNPPA
ncbi:hypothetical protein ABZ330_00275 [Streptomyces sp. NPDC006172]|uniref:hypothetical protein n=1 Tax=Streptomyces sp. NPDC006172 TaxID=3154470 RepID=UPI00340AF290